MANTYQWCQLLPEIDPDPDNKRELKKVVVSVVGRMQGSDGNGNSASVDQRIILGEPDPDNFIAHEDLTEKWIEDIMEDKCGKFFREAIDRQIEAGRCQSRVLKFPSQLKAESGE
tara:strand:- start:129 stop:473 length:345 start_codon:yes stop_codon:yes gene_type:complete